MASLQGTLTTRQPLKASAILKSTKLRTKTHKKPIAPKPPISYNKTIR